MVYSNIMKTPITYYGGKMNMVDDILPLIPKHKIYVEPFVGGGAIFWSKEPSKLEVLNDNNGHVINFYHVLQNSFRELKKLIEGTLYSRKAYKKALVIYDLPQLFSPLQKAWAFWILTNQGFSAIIGSWSYDNLGKKNKALNNKKRRFTKELAERLNTVQVECEDALKVITSRDASHTFFYIDPPYVGANQGHYGGYTNEHFKNLLETLSTLKGKFLLSSYDNPMLQEYAKDNGWFIKKLIKSKTASLKKKGKKREQKIEVLTWNYSI